MQSRDGRHVSGDEAHAFRRGIASLGLGHQRGAGGRAIMNEALIAFQPERDVLVQHRFRIFERLVAPRRPLPQEGQKGGAAGVRRAVQQLFVPCQEGSVLLDEPLGVLRLLGGGDCHIGRGAAEDVGGLIPVGPARDVDGALGRGRCRPGSRAELLHVADALVLRGDITAVTVQDDRKAELRRREAGDWRLARRCQPVISPGQGLQDGHPATPSAPSAGTSIRPSTMRARKNRGSIPAA